MNRDQMFSTVKGVGARGWEFGRGELGGFRKFILRGNVVDLAIGIVIGAAFTAVVQEFVKDLITPLIGIFGGFNFATWQFEVNKSIFYPGAFINALISFLIVALVLYFFVVRPVSAFQDRFMPKPEAPVTTRECPFCLSAIPLKATRCAYCTSQVEPVTEGNTGA